MDQNQVTTNEPTVDNDLQKAIDDITNKTNIDPVFSDPVAAPSSVPEGDTGELDEPVGPFPEPTLAVVEQTPEDIAPLEATADIPDLNIPAPTDIPAPADIPMPPAPAAPTIPEPIPAPTPEPVSFMPAENLNVHQIKEAALRDLLPLLDRLNMTPSQKFNIYRNVFEDLKDYTILEPAYRVAKEISDETERANALLYLVESIDKM